MKGINICKYRNKLLVTGEQKVTTERIYSKKIKIRKIEGYKKSTCKKNLEYTGNQPDGTQIYEKMKNKFKPRFKMNHK
jgi:hypothetical protein